MQKTPNAPGNAVWVLTPVGVNVRATPDVNAARLASLLTRRSAIAVISQRTGAHERAALRSSREMSSSPIPLDEGGAPASAATARSSRPARKLAA